MPSRGKSEFGGEGPENRSTVHMATRSLVIIFVCAMLLRVYLSPKFVFKCKFI